MDRHSFLELFIWFGSCFSAGSSIASDILYDFKYDIKAIYDADAERYEEIDGIKASTVDRLCDKDLTEAKKILAYCLENEIGIFTAADPDYPVSLKRLPDKPILLYYKGNPKILEGNLLVAVVGTRTMTEYGKRTAYSTSYDLSHGGAVIVSGMARGIDGIAHRGCLDAGGSTIAVIGCGIDRVYPPEHASLMREIIENGLVLSEYNPGTPPNGYNFPKRNRIISGISSAVLVIEAPKDSGALITANDAVKQGKRIFAMPGKIGEINSMGTNDLIKTGATMITDAADILVEFEDQFPTKIDLSRLPSMRSKTFKNPIEHRKVASEPLPPTFFGSFEKKYKSSEKLAGKAEENTSVKIDSDELHRKASKLTGNNRKIFEALDGFTLSADQIIEKTGLSTSAVMAGLTFLEIMHLTKVLPGGVYTTADRK